MRILLTTEASSAGVGRHLLDLAEGLLQRECEIHLIYSALRIDRAFSDRLESLPDVPRLRLDMRRSPHLSDLSAIHRTRTYLRRRGPFDVVHAHSSKAGLVARPAAIGSGAAVAYTPHCMYTMNPMLGRLAFRFGKAIEKSLARRSDAIIAVSPDERDHMIRIGIPADKLHCIPNGVGSHAWPDKSEVRRQFALPPAGVVIGFIGRLSPQKAPLLLVRAFAELAAGHQNVCLAIVGTGPLEPPARNLADQLGVSKRVFWLGYRTAREVMSAFDTLVMPSRYEAMPYVLLEALSAGLPIVATRVGGAELAIEHGHNGHIADAHEPESFANALRPLVESRPLRERFSEASRRKSAQFTISEMVDRIHDLYCRLVGQPDGEYFPKVPQASARLGQESQVSILNTVPVNQ